MNIVSRATGMILRPRSEWPVVDAEPTSVGSLYAQYLIPLALIGAVARFIGMSVIGLSLPFAGRIRIPFMSGLTSAIFGLVALLVGMYVWALIINALAPTFGGRKDMPSALKLATYSATPVLVAGVLSLLPALTLVQFIAAIYSLYVLYLGFPVLMKVATDRAVGYTAATVVSGMVLGMVMGAVMMVFGGGRMGMGGYGGRSIESQAAAEQAGQAIAAGVLGAAAGGSAESKAAAASLIAGAVAAGQQAEAAQRGAAANGAATSANAANAVNADPAAAMGAAAAMVGSMVSGGKAAVEPVAFQTLKEALPGSAGGMQRSNASGEKSNAGGFSVSTAEGTYDGTGGGNVTVKITDMGNASGMMSLAKMAFSLESESDRGFEKNVVLNGQKVHEKWTSSGKSSELDAFIGDRFMIEVRGNGVDMGSAEKAFSSIDLGKLKAPK